MASKSIATDGWIAVRLVVPSAGATVQVVAGQAFSDTDLSKLSIWVMRSDGTGEGSIGVGSRLEAEPEVTTTLAGHPLLTIDPPAEGGGGTCVGIGGLRLSAGTNYIVMADGVHGGMSHGELSVYAPALIAVGGISTGDNSFLVRGEDLPAIENTHAIAYPVEARSIVAGRWSEAIRNSIFATWETYRSVTDAVPTVLAIDRPGPHVSERCRDRCEVYGGAPGTYTFRVLMQGSISVPRSTLILLGADVSLP